MKKMEKKSSSHNSETIEKKIGDLIQQQQSEEEDGRWRRRGRRRTRRPRGISEKQNQTLCFVCAKSLLFTFFLFSEDFLLDNWATTTIRSAFCCQPIRFKFFLFSKRIDEGPFFSVCVLVISWIAAFGNSSSFVSNAIPLMLLNWYFLSAFFVSCLDYRPRFFSVPFSSR